jgi:hypothetical protein
MFRTASKQQLLLLAAGQSAYTALQGWSVASLLGGAAGACQLLVARAASNKGRGRKGPHKGYDRLLNQWAHMTAKPNTSNSSNSNKGRRLPSRPHSKCKIASPVVMLEAASMCNTRRRL